MATRYSDAASIVGPELAKQLLDDDDDERLKARHDDDMITKAHRGHTPQLLVLPNASDTLAALRRHNNIVNKYNVWI